MVGPGHRIVFRTAGHTAHLVLMLATEIYHRERGSLPPSDEALVGTYLKSLPDDGSADLDDGTAPTAGEPPAYEVYAVRYATCSTFRSPPWSRGPNRGGSSTSP